MIKIACHVLTFFIVFQITLAGVGAEELTDDESLRRAARRIVGGEVVTDDSAFPWMAALVTPDIDSLWDAQFCGATLIHPKWVLTAAHCMKTIWGRELRPDEVEVALRAHDLKNDDAEIVGVVRIILHPLYDDNDSSTPDSDIALLELERDVTSGEPLPVYKGRSLLKEEDGVVMGWGDTAGWGNPDGEAEPWKLRQVSLSIISNSECSTAYEQNDPTAPEIDSSMLCAGTPEGGKDSCFGDSGGPLIFQEEGIWQQAGIVSWGSDMCAQEGLYGVYARVSELNDFIDTYVPDPASEIRKLYFPHVAYDGTWETEIGLVNTAEETVSGTFRAYDGSGQEIVAASHVVTLPGHGRREILIGQEFSSPENIRYLVVESEVAGLKGYTKFYTEGRYGVAVPAVSEINSGDIYVSHVASDANWWTGLNLLNTTEESRTPIIAFNTGHVRAVSLAPGEHQAVTVSSLFKGQPPDGLRSGVIRNSVGVIGLELFGSTEESGNHYLSGILLKDRTDSDLCYPHIASDADWWTGIVAYNPSDSDCTLTIRPYSATGVALTTQEVIVGGNEKYFGTAAGLDFPESAVWFSVSASSPVTGFELFGTRNGRQMAGFTGVNMGAKKGLFAKTDADGWAGLAFVNAASETASLDLTAFNDAGVAVSTESVKLAPHAKLVGLPEAIFTGSLGDATYIAYESDREIAGFQLNGSADAMLLDGLPVLPVSD